MVAGCRPAAWVRRQLTASQEADALARRKELYEAIHPETRSRTITGGPGRGNKTNADSALVSDAPSFVESTAEVRGVSTRTIHASVQIANNLSEEARAVVGGTPVEEKKAQLLRVVQFPREQQVVAARALVAWVVC